MATGLSDGTVRLWDPETGVQQLVLQGDESPVGTLVFSPDGSKLASVGDDGIARVWALDLDDLIAIATDRLTRGAQRRRVPPVPARRTLPATLNRRPPGAAVAADPPHVER